MSLALFDRIGRLLRADAHGVVDALEERGLLVKQHLREAERALLDKQAELAAARERLDALQEHATQLAAQEERLDADVERALDDERDERSALQRFATRRFLAVHREREATEREVDALRIRCASLADEIERQSGELAELRERARHFATRRPSPAPADGAAVADEEVELELMRRRTAREGGA